MVEGMFPTAFATNQWYVAAYGDEIGRALLSRTILGEPIVFYRTTGGEAVALADRCVHRHYPLSASRRVGDTIVCGYHGFTYDEYGTCVSVPGQQRIPRAAQVKRYPTVERDSFVWIWIGDEAGAHPDTIPRAPWLGDPQWTPVSGLERVGARYGLLVDNLMDLSHETYLHAGHIGTPEVAATPITTEVDEDRAVVYVSRRMKDAECPPFYARSTGIDGRIDRWQDIEYRPPCLYLLHSRIAPTGVEPGPDGDDSSAFHVEVVYAITPETAGATHLFWAVARDFAREDDDVSDFLRDSNRTVVLQDIAALERLERVLAADDATAERLGRPVRHRELSINIDTGGLGARRLLKRMTQPPS